MNCATLHLVGYTLKYFCDARTYGRQISLELCLYYMKDFRNFFTSDCNYFVKQH